MDVNKISFYPLLLDILTDISEAHFVAIDLELSGVPSKEGNTSDGLGRPSLQTRYRETKEAAERYQILQIGLTCVKQDVDHSKYILKPYNFDLSPIIEERGLDIERIFSFQSGAVEFLLKTGFDIGRPFHHGVPYLSRIECRDAREKHAKRQDRSAIADIQIKPTETESLAFLERVRKQIKKWLNQPAAQSFGHLNIGPTLADPMEAMENDDEIGPELTRFEKRLVHQLVRAEFPQLVTISKRGFIQITRFDKKREDRIIEERKRELNGKLSRQKGFRWIIEALHGGDLSNIDLRECARDKSSGNYIFVDMDEYKARFHRAQNIMRGNPKMLVGHNCFLDFVYIYRTFIGELPDTVDEFQSRLHKTWPNIVDTKYMSTHNCGDISPVSSLEQIALQLSDQDQPIVEVDPAYKKYQNVQALHEAGYDSFLTAQVAVRLSSKLQREAAHVNARNGLSPTANSVDNSLPAVTKRLNNVDLHPNSLQTTLTRAPKGPDQPPTEAGFTPSVPGQRWEGRGDPSLPPVAEDDLFQYNPKQRRHRQKLEKSCVTIDGGMPPLTSEFWHIYGNKMRVFGTDEGVCILDPTNLESPNNEVEDGGVNLAAASEA